MKVGYVVMVEGLFLVGVDFVVVGGVVEVFDGVLELVVGWVFVFGVVVVVDVEVGVDVVVCGVLVVV